MEKLLSNHDINNIVGENVPVIISSKLHNIEDIDQLFGNGDKALILYENFNNGKSVNGHWTCLLRKNDQIIFYDPYADFIDDQLLNIDKKYREDSNQTKNYLSELLYHSPYEEIHYNDHPHQRHMYGVNTCGRHCSVFLKLGLDVDDYNELLEDLKNIYNNKNFDELIVDLTKNFI